jgi:hypothetical protein
VTFEEATRKAALAAREAVNRTLRQHRQRRVWDEDDLTGVLVGQLDAALSNLKTGGLTWDAAILRHRGGKAAQERRVGADLLIHVAMKTPQQSYSKGVLVQAKRIGRDELLSRREHGELVHQCERMLAITASAFVFDYTRHLMRCGAATRISGSPRRDLYRICGWTSYRFFLELFRCPIGDPRITSALVDELPAGWGLEIRAKGQLTEKERAVLE